MQSELIPDNTRINPRLDLSRMRLSENKIQYPSYLYVFMCAKMVAIVYLIWMGFALTIIYQNLRTYICSFHRSNKTWIKFIEAYLCWCADNFVNWNKFKLLKACVNKRKLNLTTVSVTMVYAARCILCNKSVQSYSRGTVNLSVKILSLFICCLSIENAVHISVELIFKVLQSITI